MEVIDVAAKPRKEKGGGSGRQLRAGDRLPAVLYGNKQDPVLLSIDLKIFEKDLKHLRGENVMIDLAIEGTKGKQRVFLREAQRDPQTDNLLHIDLLRIDENQKMHFMVPVHHVVTRAGVKTGGILDQHLRHLEIKSFAKDLPSHIDADVSDLLVHHSLHVSDIQVPDTIEILNPSTDVVFTVLPAKKIEEEVAPGAEEEVEKEPEVIGEKKEEGKERKKEEKK